MIIDRINDDFKSAMKNKEVLKLSALRLLKSAISYALIEENKRDGDKASDELVMKVIAKQIKQRQDSIENYEKANRSDLADKEKEEMAIFQAYMPEQLADDALEALVKSAIGESQAASKKEMGKVMKIVMEKAKGQAGGKRVSAMVQKLLP